MKPIPLADGRTLRTFLGVRRRSQFIRSNAAVGVPVEPQDELAPLTDELVASDLAILVFVKITEVCFRQCGVGSDCRELGRIETSVAVAVSRRKYPVKMALPFVAGVDAVVIGVPNIRPDLGCGVLRWPGGAGCVACGSRLGKRERGARQQQPYNSADQSNRK